MRLVHLVCSRVMAERGTELLGGFEDLCVCLYLYPIHSVAVFLTYNLYRQPGPMLGPWEKILLVKVNDSLLCDAPENLHFCKSSMKLVPARPLSITLV